MERERDGMQPAGPRAPASRVALAIGDLVWSMEARPRAEALAGFAAQKTPQYSQALYRLDPKASLPGV